MSSVTFQVLEGLERGRFFSALKPPFTIGREDGNVIQLNDERVSRFHAKVQEDGTRVILTDLESTNGTRVNGRPVQMHVLQVGDHVSIGRCLLLFGSPEEIAWRIQRRRDRNTGVNLEDGTAVVAASPPVPDDEPATPSPVEKDPEEPSLLFPDGPPELPQELRPVQRAQLADLLAFVHDRLRAIVEEVRVEPTHEEESGAARIVPWPLWQDLLQLEMQLAKELQKVTDPDAS